MALHGSGASGDIRPVMIAPSPPVASAPEPHWLRARRVGIDTHQEAVVYMRADCHVCRSEGLTPQSRVLLRNGTHEIIATLHHVTSSWLGRGEAGLSEAAWRRLQVSDGAQIYASHPKPVESLSSVRSPNSRPS